jgi:predicted PurR-regulated permease PerM
LLDYLTFSLTISSILLALITIFYSFTSNSNIFSSVNNLSELSKNISNISDGLKNNVSELSSKIETVPTIISVNMASISEKLDNTISIINNKIEEIPVTLKDIEKNIVGKQDILKNMLDEKLANPVTKAMEKSNESIAKKELELTEELIDNYLNITSFAGLLCAYTFMFAYNKKISLTIKEVEKILKYFTFDYIQGYIVCAYALKLFYGDYSVNELSYTITYYNNFLIKKIDKILKKRGKDFEKEEENKKYVSLINEIENYFSEK